METFISRCFFGHTFVKAPIISFFYDFQIEAWGEEPVAFLGDEEHWLCVCAVGAESPFAVILPHDCLTRPCLNLRRDIYSLIYRIENAEFVLRKYIPSIGSR